MTDTQAIDQDKLSQLDDQQWRRLGITQTFDRLLVETAAADPGGVDEVRDAVGEKLSGGAAKFWSLSFDGLKKDLCRRRVLAEAGGELSLHDDFADRLQRLLDDLENAVSHVQPTPGVTLEDVLAKSKEREEREKVAKKRRSTRARAARSASSATPRKRKSSTSGAASAATAEKASAPAAAAPEKAPARRPKVAPPNKLFTSLKLNKLLDSLDNTTLLKTQLGSRLDLSGANLDRFLQVTDGLEVTRVTRDDMVELHWKGQELARTAAADRRMALIELVRELRAYAERELDED